MASGSITSNKNNWKFEYTCKLKLGGKTKIKIPVIRLKFYNKTLEYLTSLGVAYRKPGDTY